MSLLSCILRHDSTRCSNLGHTRGGADILNVQGVGKNVVAAWSVSLLNSDVSWLGILPCCVKFSTSGLSQVRGVDIALAEFGPVRG